MSCESMTFSRTELLRVFGKNRSDGRTLTDSDIDRIEAAQLERNPTYKKDDKMIVYWGDIWARPLH